jgi:diguanylate cyclase (GGDEF)-like protein
MFIGFLLIGIIGLLDYSTGYEYAFSIFYVLPISLVTWVNGERVGTAASVTSAIVWFLADLYSGHPYTKLSISYWNTFIRLAFFILITFLLSSLKRSLEREKEISRTDFLTGASNSRYFYEVMQAEFNRHKRNARPFTIAYMDLDNLKAVNDEHGHAEGDRVLKSTVSLVRKRIRNTDLIARLGGDEFALFLPETDEDSAPAIINDLFTGKAKGTDNRISYSVGVVTFKVPPDSINEMIKIADRLMYSVKSGGKNSIKYSIYEGE